MSDMGDLSALLVKNKDLWARAYDEVIAPNLETEWKKRRDQYEKQLKSKDEKYQILLNRVNDEIIASANLKDENARLKRLLQKQDNASSLPLDQLEANTPDATVPAAEFRNIISKFDELNKRYQSDNQKIKYLERKNTAVMQKNQEMKESVKAWQEYCDRNINKHKTRISAVSKKDQTETPALNEDHDARLKTPPSPGNTGMATLTSLVTKGHSSPAPSSPPLRPRGTSAISSWHIAMPGMTTVAKENTGIDTDLAEQRSSPLPDETTPTNPRSAPIASNAASLDQSSSVRLNSSQTTEDDVAERNNTIICMETEEDDIPLVVSERSLKRKRKPSTAMNVYTDRLDGTTSKPIAVKDEPYSSPPAQMTPAPYELHRTDTIDLDEIPPSAIRTPRHGQLGSRPSMHSKLTGTLRHQRSSSAPFNGSLVKTEPAEDSAHHSDMEAAISTATANARSRRGRGESAHVPANVLRPLDPNVVANSTHDTPNKRMKRSEMLEREKHELLMESGEALPLKARRPPPSAARARYNERIRELKGDSTPSKSVVNTPKTAPPRVRPLQALAPSSTIDRQTHTPPNQTRRPLEPRTEPTADRRPIWTLTPPSESTRKAAAPSVPKKPQEPLRSKPVEQLGMQDFKPNPIYNQGYTHAFSETVRKQSDRLCLPGCTSAQCCGSSFRALALVSAPLTPSEEEKLLQDYLGDAYDAFGLTQMSQDERNAIVLQARTRHLAKKYGKHKQAYERGRSPPGFWRTGFPSTQEVEADKENARQLEREIVNERWLEAMRKDGKWVFRDE